MLFRPILPIILPIKFAVDWGDQLLAHDVI